MGRPADGVARAIEATTAGATDVVGRARPGRLALWLPGDTAIPWPSPRIAATPPQYGGVSTGLEPWTVPMLAFDPSAAIRLLLAGTGRTEEPLGSFSGEERLAADRAGRRGKLITLRC